MLKLKLQYFGYLMQRTDSFEKTLMLGKIEGGRRMGWQDEMVRWHHQLNGHEFEQAPGVGDGQGSLACCSPWGRKESDVTEQLNWTEPTWGDHPSQFTQNHHGGSTQSSASMEPLIPEADQNCHCPPCFWPDLPFNMTTNYGRPLFNRVFSWADTFTCKRYILTRVCICDCDSMMNKRNAFGILEKQTLADSKYR